MLACMDCFHLLGLIVLAGLPLAFLIRCLDIGKAAGSGHRTQNTDQGEINMRAVHLTTYGNPVEGLKYVDIPAPGAPGPNQVLIGVEFAPLNPSDLLLARGLYALHPALPTVIGNEGVGRVVEVGAGVRNVKPGDRVLAPLSSFTWRERMVIPADGLFALSPDADSRQLAMAAINPPTAALLLSEYVDLKPGEWVVQNSANSGVGRWVIRVREKARPKDRQYRAAAGARPRTRGSWWRRRRCGFS